MSSRQDPRGCHGAVPGIWRAGSSGEGRADAGWCCQQSMGSSRALGLTAACWVSSSEKQIRHSPASQAVTRSRSTHTQRLMHCGCPGDISCQESPSAPSTCSLSFALRGAFPCFLWENQCFQWFIVTCLKFSFHFASLPDSFYNKQNLSKNVEDMLSLLPLWRMFHSPSWLNCTSRSEDRNTGHFWVGGHLTPRGQ